jgi:truncated hemoglobin YjbI
MTTEMTLYDRFGGLQTIQVVTEAFYRKVLQDELLAPFFTGTDMNRQTGMLAQFLASAFGGPMVYSGRDLRTAHAGMPLTDEHFDRVIGHLASTLTDFGVGGDDIAAAGAVAETVRDDVLNRAR